MLKPAAWASSSSEGRPSLGDPLLLEPVLATHPGLRVYVMHGGWPMIDRMIALLHEYPQVYVDPAVIDFTQPRAEFRGYLQRLVHPGHGKRIMYGSDQMVWPGSIPSRSRRPGKRRSSRPRRSATSCTTTLPGSCGCRADPAPIYRRVHGLFTVG